MGRSTGRFHAGEAFVQRSAGLAEQAEAVGRIVGDSISRAAADFLHGQRLAIASSLDESGRPWASVLSGPAGFLRAEDARRLRIVALPAEDDPLAANLRARPELGLLVLDPPTRRRMRVNGRASLSEDGLLVRTDEVYGNCPKYIQRRRLRGEVEQPRKPARRAPALDARQQEWIARADTMFLASFHPDSGADASHRGGMPGFLRVESDRRIALPDYPGNAMFNTLGNLHGYPRVGLLFLDFENGDTLQLTGRAELRFEPARALAIEVDEVRETPGGHRLAWELVEYSSSNPEV
jgi:predicted pyridoxine 5'-phosphate oxidase superfamily flavin-nucleotide-binding protein